jgi:hypothetical protein
MVLTPISILNQVAAVFGGVWLAIDGQWTSVGIGLAFWFGAPYVWSTFVSIFFLVFVPLKRLGVALSSRASQNLVLVTFATSQTVLFVFSFLTLRTLLANSLEPGEGVYAILIWEYGIMMSVMTAIFDIVKKGGGNDAGWGILMLACSISLLAAMVVSLLLDPGRDLIILTLGFPVFFGFLMQNKMSMEAAG